LYKSSPAGWTFQIRAPIGLGRYGQRDGKDFIVASATLDADDLHAVRDAFDAQIHACCGEFETGSGEHGDECLVAEVERLRKLARAALRDHGIALHENEVQAMIDALREIATCDRCNDSGVIANGGGDPDNPRTVPCPRCAS
jgi:hypothetical protein